MLGCSLLSLNLTTSEHGACINFVYVRVRPSDPSCAGYVTETLAVLNACNDTQLPHLPVLCEAREARGAQLRTRTAESCSDTIFCVWKVSASFRSYPWSCCFRLLKQERPGEMILQGRLRVFVMSEKDKRLHGAVCDVIRHCRLA